MESGAGCGIGVDDAHYEACGARVVPSASDVFSSADMIVKVKEPQPAPLSTMTSCPATFGSLTPTAPGRPDTRGP